MRKTIFIIVSRAWRLASGVWLFYLVSGSFISGEGGLEDRGREEKIFVS